MAEQDPTDWRRALTEIVRESISREGERRTGTEMPADERAVSETLLIPLIVLQYMIGYFSHKTGKQELSHEFYCENIRYTQ